MKAFKREMKETATIKGKSAISFLFQICIEKVKRFFQIRENPQIYLLPDKWITRKSKSLDSLLFYFPEMNRIYIRKYGKCVEGKTIAILNHEYFHAIFDRLNVDTNNFLDKKENGKLILQNKWWISKIHARRVIK